MSDDEDYGEIVVDDSEDKFSENNFHNELMKWWKFLIRNVL